MHFLHLSTTKTMFTNVTSAQAYINKKNKKTDEFTSCGPNENKLQAFDVHETTRCDKIFIILVDRHPDKVFLYMKLKINKVESDDIPISTFSLTEKG